jgi:hypothetical protein
VAGPSITDAAFSTGSRIGRYFSLVSSVPSALFIVFVYALVRSGAWTGRPNLDSAGHALSHITLGQASVLLLLSFALALFLHPLQFAITQALEGYWGTHPIARGIAALKIRRHRDRFFHVRQIRNVAQETLKHASPTPRSRPGQIWVPSLVEEQEFRRALESYPRTADRVMPTRLGNILRRYEDLAGSQYALSAITIAPHLLLVAPDAHARYLRETREQLDLAVRLCALSLLAFVVACCFLVDDGAWLIVALAPYAIAYTSYRGAIIAAHEYGTALTTVIDLDRFGLYQHLHVPLPRDSQRERQRNDALMDSLQSGAGFVSYEHPKV